jgi:hypothetical protein
MESERKSGTATNAPQSTLDRLSDVKHALRLDYEPTHATIATSLCQVTALRPSSDHSVARKAQDASYVASTYYKLS